MTTLDELRRLVEEATPGPWEWGEGWDELPPPPWDREYMDLGFPKYADLALKHTDMGATVEIVPLCVDHYHIEWDEVKPAPDKPDRDFIVALRNAWPRIDAVLRAVGELDAAQERYDEALAKDDALAAEAEVERTRRRTVAAYRALENES